MSKTDAFEASTLNHILNNAAIANIGDAGGLPVSVTAGSLFVSLFTVTPSDSAAGTEAAYSAYARVAVTRGGGGWTIAGATPTTASNAATITFPAHTAGASETVVAFGVHTASTLGDLLYWGPLNANLVITSAPSITPEFAVGALTITED